MRSYINKKERTIKFNQYYKGFKTYKYKSSYLKSYFYNKNNYKYNAAVKNWKPGGAVKKFKFKKIRFKHYNRRNRAYILNNTI